MAVKDDSGIQRRTNVMTKLPLLLPDTVEMVTYDTTPAATENALVMTFRMTDGTIKMYKSDTIPTLQTTGFTLTLTEIGGE